MAYGLKLWDASGVQVLDLTDRLSRLRYSYYAAANESGSIDLPDIDGKQTVQFAIGASLVWTDGVHVVSRSGTIISWSPAPMQSTWTQRGPSTILVFLYT